MGNEPAKGEMVVRGETLREFTLFMRRAISSALKNRYIYPMIREIV